MASQTDYAKEKEVQHKRKIVLPNVIPWEYGSNKYATQKGSGGFGTIRNAKLNIKSSKDLSESNDGVVPQLNCPPMHHTYASQSKSTSFGAMREQVTKVVDTNGDSKVLISKIVDDKMTETMLKKWNQPNREATNSEIGRRRNALTETVGGHRMKREDTMKCLAAIPRFQDPRMTIAHLDKTNGSSYQPGLQRNRQATTNVEGLNRDISDQLDTNRYMAWLGGQLTLQSQSKTGGFNKTRDVVSQNYYNKVDGTKIDAEKLRKRLQEVQLQKSDIVEQENNDEERR
ncbi:unnamed protein product [Caenorhabditis auriculariae]|uniref:Uncharacterized protein n=1 Tax=Caenorhabditis auriculariae TaxID=2777116 RepID=A0A8S1H0U0_9PELO|nr:unnamed protein product [Caenorhabditis auriculariae]